MLENRNGAALTRTAVGQWNAVKIDAKVSTFALSHDKDVSPILIFCIPCVSKKTSFVLINVGRVALTNCDDGSNELSTELYYCYCFCNGMIIHFR